jgi:hypothetical protein
MAEGQELIENAETKEEADEIAADLASNGYKVVGIEEIRV